MRPLLLALAPLALLASCAKTNDPVTSPSPDPSTSAPDEGPSEYLDVYAVLTPEQDARVAELSEALGKVGLTTPHKRGYPAHCTLYLTMYPKAIEAQVVEEVSRIAGEHEPFAITLGDLRPTAAGWLFVNIDTSASLRTLSDLVAERLHARRTQSQPLPEWVVKSPEKKASFLRYGSPNVGAFFEPHVTLLAGEKQEEVERFLAMKPENRAVRGNVVAIAVGEADKLGQVTRVIARYDLGKR